MSEEKEIHGESCHRDAQVIVTYCLILNTSITDLPVL